MSWLHKVAAMPQGLRLDGQLDDQEQRIFALLKQFVSATNGPTLRVCGGWVRDKLLGKPSKDIDISVEGVPAIDFARALKQWADQRYGPRIVTNPKGNEERPDQLKGLAVAFLRIYGQDIEMMPVRGKERYGRDRTDIQVDTNVGPDEDAYRRDLTINSMFYNIQTGAVEDLTGQGYDDLQSMILRPPCRPYDPASGMTEEQWRAAEVNRVYNEDPLRVLRLFRFNSRYPNSRIDPFVHQVIKNNPELQDKIVRKIHNPEAQFGITPERTAIELRKLMQGNQPDVALKSMWGTGLLQRMLGIPMEDLNQQNEHHELPLMEHTWEVIRNMNALARREGLSDDERGLMNTSALGHDLGKFDEAVQSHDGTNMHYYRHEDASQKKWDWFADALKLSTQETDFVSAVIGNHMVPHTHLRSNISDDKLREFLGQHPRLWRYYYLHAQADAMSKGREPDPAAGQPYQEMMQRVQGLPGIEYKNHRVSFPTLVDGKTIMDLAHIPPGPKVKEIMDAIRREQYRNFGRRGPIPLEEARQLAINVVRRFRQMPINGNDIINMVGLPAKPPRPGMQSYVELVKNRVNQALDQNPNLTREQALAMVQEMMSGGHFEPYRVAV